MPVDLPIVLRHHIVVDIGVPCFYNNDTHYELSVSQGYNQEEPKIDHNQHNVYPK